MATYGPDVAPGLPCWSLIGRFGSSGQPFEIGASANFQAAGGELYLGVNDNYFPDNIGSWSADVTAGSTFVQGDAYLLDAVGHGSPDEAKCTCGIHEPVNVSTGDFYDTHTYLSIPGAGVPLQFTPTYDASVAQAGTNLADMGPGWSTNFSLSLAASGPGSVTLDDASGDPVEYTTAGAATVTEENGAEVTFYQFGAASPEPAWCASDATSSVYCPEGPRVLAQLAPSACPGSTTSSWTLTREVTAPETLCFSSAGTLNEILDANGNSLSLGSYSPGTGQAACPTGDTCSAWTSSGSGRALVLALNSSSELTSVFDAASGGPSISLAYSGTGCSWSSGPSAVCAINGPSPLSTTFEYASGTYDMTLEDPSTGATTTNTYYTSGAYAGRIDVQQISGQTTEEWAYSYAPISGTSNGELTTVVGYQNGPSGTSNTSTYTSYGNVLMGTTDATGASTSDLPDSASLLPDSSTDGDNNITTNTYQDYDPAVGQLATSANVTSTTDALGNVTETQYNAMNEPWCQVDPAEYDNGVRCPASQLTAAPGAGASNVPTTPCSTTSVSPCLGATLTFYNAGGQQVAQTDPRGFTSFTAYTSVGLPYCTVSDIEYSEDSVTCPGAAPTSPPTTETGYTTNIYASTGDLVSTTTPTGATTLHCYFWENGSGQCAAGASGGTPEELYSTTDPDGVVTAYTYNAAGQTLTQSATSGAYTATTQFAYDAQGRQYCEVDPYQYSQGTRCPTSEPTSPPTGTPGYTDTIYNSAGQVEFTTNPSGGTTEYAYDGQGNRYCAVAPRSYATGTNCPTTLPLTAQTPGSDPYPGATIDSFDDDGRVVQETNPIGGITLTTYDGAGNVTETQVESGASGAPTITTTTGYDADNRPISTTTGTNTSLSSYDPDGNVLCSVSANAYAEGASHYQCPAWVASWIATPPSPSSLYSSAPDANQANNVATSFYDADGDMVQTTTAAGSTTLNAYDAGGSLFCTVSPDNVALGTTCPSAPPSTPPSAGTGSPTGYELTTFDADGHPATVTDPTGNTTTTSYDPDGNQLAVTNPDGATTTDCYYWQTSTCAAGAPSGGGAANSLYSTTTGGVTTSYTYEPGGQRASITTPGGTTEDSYRATTGQLSEVQAASTETGYTTPSTASYTYNVDGTRASMTDGTGTTNYSYDAAGDTTGQAFTASASGLSSQNVEYSYYPTGALEAVTYPTYSGHSSPDATYSYDANGNMAQVTDWLGNTTTFSHDNDGNLTAQDNNVSGSNPTGTSSTTFSYDASDTPTSTSSILAQTCGGNETLTQAFTGTSGDSAQLRESADSYTASCSGQGSVQTYYNYNAAGQVTYQGSSPQGSSSNNFSYDGAGDPTEFSSHDSSGALDTYTQAFNADGEITSQTPMSGSGGTTTSYSFDSLGDQTQAATTTGSAGSTYFQNGEMASASTPTGSSSYLYTGDGLAAATFSGSLAWSPAQLVDGANTVKAVSCATSTFCVAVDNHGNELTFNGSTWTAAPIAGTAPLNSVSCTSPSFCAAVANTGYAYTFNGSSWTSNALDTSHYLESVSCTTSTFCVAVDSTGRAYEWNGSWSSSYQTPDGAHILDSVSCTSSSFCMTVDNQGKAFQYSGGTSWSSASDIDSSEPLDSVSCTSSTFCIAVDAGGRALSFSGSGPSWSSASTIDSGEDLASVSCATSSMCEAVDQAGNVLTYAGNSWSAPSQINNSRVFYGVSCTTTGYCAAVGAAGYVLDYAFTSEAWGAALDADGSATVDSVSCASASFCMAVDTGGSYLTFNGSTWSSPVHEDSSYAFNAVSCPTSSFCVAVDSHGNEYTFNGSSWSTSDIDFSRVVNAVSCPTTSFCVAVDASGHAITYTGTWSSTISDIDGSTALEAVSCHSATFCVAVDHSGHALTDTGSSWSSTDIDGSAQLNAISCPTTSFCAATDGSGNALIYTGSSWASSNIDGSRVLYGVSCASASLCDAVSSMGYVLTYNGSIWSSPEEIDSTRAVSAVSCPSARFCAAVDHSGETLAVAAEPNDVVSSQLDWDTTGSLPTVLSDSVDDYIYGPTGTPVEAVALSTSTPSFMSYSSANSTWLTSNAAGDETGFWGYDAYGTPAFGTPTSSFGFAGQYTDTTTGFSNLRARWYDSAVGEFTTVDPALLVTDQPYQYAGDDPVNETDPSGEWVVKGTIGSVFTETAAQDFVNNLLTPTIPEVTFNTELGNRRIDAYAIVPRWINEVKTGTVNNDAATDLQVAKDEILLEARQGVVSATKADGTAVAGAKLPVLGDTWWVLPNLGETSYVTQPQIDALTSGGINLVILEYKQMSNDSIFQSDEAGQSQVAYAAERDDGVQIRSLFLSQNYGPVCPVPLSVD